MEGPTEKLREETKVTWMEGSHVRGWWHASRRDWSLTGRSGTSGTGSVGTMENGAGIRTAAAGIAPLRTFRTHGMASHMDLAPLRGWRGESESGNSRVRNKGLISQDDKALYTQ